MVKSESPKLCWWNWWIGHCDSWLYHWSEYLPPLVWKDHPSFLTTHFFSETITTSCDANLSYGLGKLDRLRSWRSPQECGAAFSQRTILLDLYNVFPWKSTACWSTKHQFWNFTNYLWNLADIFFQSSVKTMDYGNKLFATIFIHVVFDGVLPYPTP